MQPLVLHNQNTPDFYFLRPLYFKNIQAFHQIGSEEQKLFEVDCQTLKDKEICKFLFD